MNAFEKTLREINEGKSVSDLSEALTNLVAAVRLTGRPGKLKYTLTVKPASKGETVTLMLADEIDVKTPKSERLTSVFFADQDNVLLRNDPRQKEFELRTVKNEEEAPLKQVAAS